MTALSRSQPMTASAAIESCVVCGGPLSAKRIIVDGKIYHEGCCFKSHPPHTWEDYSRLSDENASLRAQIASARKALEEIAGLTYTDGTPTKQALDARAALKEIS